MVKAMGRKAKKSWMTPKRFRECVEAIGVTQKELAARLDLSPMHLTNFAKGDSPIPRTISIILNAIVAGTMELPSERKSK